MTTPTHIFLTPNDIGDYVADRILREIDAARAAGRSYLLGSPTGRTPRPIYAAMAQRLAAQPRDLSHVTLVMMDEYLVPGANGLEYAPPNASWASHHFVGVEILAPLNATLPPAHQLRADKVWFPMPNDPAEYDARIAGAGGIDLFLLASGASDGHVAFNPPGSPRDSLTRVIPLSDETRRDNLQTFPAFGTLDAVPRFGVSVGVATIVSSRAALMVVWGAGKRLTMSRIAAATRYDPEWPATMIHECANGEIVADEAAAGDPSAGTY